MQNHIFDITNTRDFLQHFLTDWRTKSISPEMVEKLKENSESDPYAAYGYGRWLSLVNPDGKSIRKAEQLLTWAGSNGVQDANAALARLFYEGRTEADEAMPHMHAFMIDSAYKQGSELAQYQTLENLIYGEYGVRKDPALAADILRKHLEKNPESDPIYYDLLGQALESSDTESAEKAYISSLERGNTESYFSLANFYRTRREESRACAIAEEGARLGAVNCHRFKAGMEYDDFLALSPEERTILHQEIDEGLDYAIARHDGFACFLKGVLLYLGQLGYSENHEEALRPLSRGCELGKADCFWLKASIQHMHGDNLSDEMKSSAQDIARACLQAVRMGDREGFTLEQVARGYVTGLLSKYEKEIERLWLKEYLAANPEEDDTKDSAAVTLVYPQGFYYAMDVEEGEDDLDLEALSSLTEARGYDVVHYSPILNRITKTLSLDQESCHLAMLVDKDGLMRDLPDNMVGTLVYGQGQEIRGTVVFVLEDDNTYRLMPMKGVHRIYMFLQMLGAATGDLMRQPSSEELEAIGVDIARACLQAVRLGDREVFTLEQVARGYVTGLLSKYEKEIERLWLKEYLAANPEEDDTKDSAAVMLVYPQGFYYAMDVEEGEDDLDLEALSSRTEARGYDVVHYSPILNRITKTLALDKESCHLAMLVDKDGLMRDLPDNMVGTLVYGQGQEIRGTVVFVLEDDNTYRLMPMKGLQRIYMFLQMLGAATGDLMRQPSSEELEAIGVEDSGGFEEYDDPDILDDESGQEQEIEEDMVAADTSREEEPRELVVPVAEVKEGINNCNLCIDTLIVTLPDSREFWFKSNDDLILELGIKSTIEKNITRHGGYMIDEWQYVDTRQIPIDIRSHICFKFTDEQ